jgi:hypothetical protein
MRFRHLAIGLALLALVSTEFLIAVILGRGDGLLWVWLELVAVAVY